MTLSWLGFMCLALVGNLMYSAGAKTATATMHPFLFALVLGIFATAGHAVTTLLAKYGFGVDIISGTTKQTMLMAALGGLGVVVCEVGFFFAIRNGSLVASQAILSVGTLVVLAIISVLAFREDMSWAKVGGILLGAASLYLLSQKSGH